MAFIGACIGYYELCKRVGLVTGWGFLLGFLPALPVALVAARNQYRQATPVRRCFWVVAAFSVYFWGSGILTLWKLGSGLG